MNLSLEFAMTTADLRQLNALRGWRRFSLLRYVVAIFVLLLGTQSWSIKGLDWTFGLYVAFAVYLFLRDFIFVSLLVPLLRLSTKQELITQVSINEETIAIEQTKHRREFQWSAMATTGTAREIENHFWLECGRGGVWIPKRAFPTADDMANFRALVKDKMGERCQFSP